jgi:hypothetical protein
MAKKNYKITLTLTAYGVSGSNPNSMATRINEAVGAAGRNNVCGKNGANPLDPHVHREPPDTGVKSDGTIVWHVHGELSDVGNMIARWTGSADPADPKGHPAFKPANVIVVPADDP